MNDAKDFKFMFLDEAKQKEFRCIPFNMEMRAEKAADGTEKLYARGYASTFDEYILWESEDGIKFFEQIDRHAFDNCDFSDCVFRKDHTGTVFARASNGSLKTWVDDHGLGDEAELSRTSSARQMHEELVAGMYPQQSFAFVASRKEYLIDQDGNWHRRILEISKCYDCSPVTWPANPNTDINARSLFDGAIKEYQEECLKRNKEKELALAKAKAKSIT